MSANFTRSDFPCYDDDCVSEVEDGTFEYTEETEGGYVMCISQGASSSRPLCSIRCIWVVSK